MDLVYVQIECEHSFSKMLASQQSDKTGLDVTLEYFESKLEVALTTLDTSEIYEVYLLHSDVTIAHPILGHSYEYSSILEYENSPSGIKKKLIEDWFNAGSKNKKSSPSIVVIAALENQGEIELFEKLIPSTDELMGNVSVIFFRKDKQWSMSQYDKTAEKFEGIVSGDTSYLIPISNLQIENLDRTIKFLGLSKQKSPFFLDYLISLGGTPSSTSDAYDDDDHGEGMDLDDVYDQNQGRVKRNHSEEFKKEVALASFEDGATLKSVGEKFGVNPTLVRNWRLKYGENIQSKIEQTEVNQMEDVDMLEQPDEIDEQIDDLDDEVWDRGYKCQTADGVWYEVFVNDTIKSIHPDINTENEPYDAIFSGYKGLMLDFYDDYGQITFFVPNGESEKTLEALTEYFI